MEKGFLGAGDICFLFLKVQEERIIALKSYACCAISNLNYHLYRQAQELIWNRCISTHNAPGRNIPCDLHQEHLNRIVKDGIRRLNTNKTDNMILKLGKTVGMISPLLDNFDECNNVKKPSGLHNAPGFSEDLNKIIEHLKKYTIFSYQKGRSHQTFPNPRDTLHSFNKNAIIDWIIKHI